MKITIAQGPFLPVPPIKGGAAEKAWFSLGKEFARLGHEVTHLSRKTDGMPTDEAIDGVIHHRVRGHTARRSLALRIALDFFYTRRVIAALPPGDVIISNTFWLPILYRKPERGRPYVHVARFPKGQLKYYGEEAILQTVSQPIRTAILQEVPHRADKTSVIPYPLPESYLSSVEDTKGKTLLYAGRIHPEKGLGLLIDAFSKASPSLPGWALRIVGPHEYSQGGGGHEYLRQLKGRTAGLPILFTGPLFNAADLMAEYDRAKIFIYPSLAERGETFGLALLEAMARGCTPLCSSLACFGDFIKHGDNGLIFDHRSPLATGLLADLIIRACSSHTEAETLAKHARNTALEYTTERIARLFLEDFARFKLR